jgi:hypothetical protein
MKTIAGPGKINIATPARRVPKPKTDTANLRQNENGRGGFLVADELLGLLAGLVVDGFKKQQRELIGCATAARRI